MHHHEKKREPIYRRDRERVVWRIHREFEMRIGVNDRMVPCMFMNLPGEEGSYIIEDWSKTFTMAAPIDIENGSSKMKLFCQNNLIFRTKMVHAKSAQH